MPFEKIHIHDERTVGPPSTSADGYSAYGAFTIPEGADGKTIYGACSLFLGVDDWGSMEVKNSGGNIVAQVDLKENPASRAYNHPLNSRLEVPEGWIASGVRFNLAQEDCVIAMRCYTDGSVLPIRNRSPRPCRKITHLSTTVFPPTRGRLVRIAFNKYYGKYAICCNLHIV